MIHERWSFSTIRYTRVSDRVLYLDMFLLQRKYRIIAVYAPHAGYTVEAFNICFDSIRKVIRDGQQIGFMCSLVATLMQNYIEAGVVSGYKNFLPKLQWRSEMIPEI